MDKLVVHNVENEDRPKLKFVSIKSTKGNPNSVLSTTLNNVVYLEDVGSYLNSKFESIGSTFMNKDMELVFNHDMTMKLRFEHIKELDLFKYHFYHELDTDEWTQIILSRIHDGKLWMQDNAINIYVNLIHEVIGFSKKGSELIDDKWSRRRLRVILNQCIMERLW